jgi:DNA-binding LacI/PurR family transcriptional regulator
VPPTIHDVASRAGVSKSLVSLVLRGSPKVSSERRAAVLRAVEELGYRPNLMARSLVQQRTNVIGMILDDLHNPFFAEVVDGVQQRAAQDGYRVLIISGHRAPKREVEAIETMLELRADGLILIGAQVDSASLARASEVVPVVLVTRTTRLGAVDCVTNDDRLGATLAVEHLLSFGHRRIAHIHAGAAPGARPRRNAYEAALRRAGLEPLVAEGAFTEAGGSHGVRGILELGPPPTAIFAANDIAAVGALSELKASGLRVPQDVSLVGYDNIELAGLCHIDLTTVDQPRLDMGTTAVSLLLERLRGHRSTARRIVRAPSLVVRGTTGPPRGANKGDSP